MCTNAHVNNHMLTDTYVWVHTYMYTHVYTLPLSPICMLSSHVTGSVFKLKLTLSRLGIGPHRNQVNNPPQQNTWKTPAENSHAQWSCRLTACKFNKDFLPHSTPVLPPHPTKANHSPSPHTNQPSDRKGLTQKQVDMKTLTLNPPWNSLLLVGNHIWKE